MHTSYEIGRGESRTYTITVRGLDGETMDLTDAQIVFYVYDLTGAVVIEKRSTAAGGSDDEIEIPDQEADSGALEGIAYLKLTTSDTDIEQGARWADCWVVTAGESPEQLLVDDHAAFSITGQAPPSFAP